MATVTMPPPSTGTVELIDPHPERHTQLRKGALGLIDMVVIAVSSTAPAYSIATSLGPLLYAVAIGGVIVGLGGPAAVWVGFLPVMGIAMAFYYLNRHVPNCGASYTWVGKALHPSLGFLNGWVILMTDLIFMAFAGPQCGSATLQLLNNANITSIFGLSLDAANTTSDVVVGVFWLAVVTWMVVVGIKVAAKFQWLLLGLEYVIVMGFAIIGFFHGGGTPFSWNWLNPFALGWTGLSGGVVVAVFLYWGWDTAANVNEESEDSNENPGKGGMLGMAALLLIFMLALISIQMVVTPTELDANNGDLLNFFASKMVPQPWASLAVLALLSSTIATLQTTLLPSARTALSMGRDGVLGKVWGTISPRWKTPWIGSILFGAGAAIIAILSLSIGQLTQIVVAGVTAIGILVAFYYGMAGIACAVYFRKVLTKKTGTLIMAGVIPVLSGLVLFGLAIILIYNDWTSTDSIAFDGSNARFQVLIPIIVLVLGIPAYMWSRIRTRGKKIPYYDDPREAATDFDPIPEVAAL